MLAAMSAERPTSTGTLPGPTPNAGLPLEYAARTRPDPPVARITAVFSCRMSACVASVVGAVRHCMIPSGAPAATAAACSTSHASAVDRLACGCGLSTTALPALRLIMHLKFAVDVGFVVGAMAATT